MHVHRDGLRGLRRLALEARVVEARRRGIQLDPVVAVALEDAHGGAVQRGRELVERGELVVVPALVVVAVRQLLVGVHPEDRLEDGPQAGLLIVVRVGRGVVPLDLGVQLAPQRLLVGGGGQLGRGVVGRVGHLDPGAPCGALQVDPGLRERTAHVGGVLGDGVVDGGLDHALETEHGVNLLGIAQLRWSANQ